MMPIYALLIVVVVLVVGLAQAHFRAHHMAKTGWEDLIRKLEPVPMEAIRLGALEYLNPAKGQLATEPNELWEMIGGQSGLERMRANATVLIALAAYTQRWTPVEGVVVAERMRRDGLALRRAAWKMSLTVFFGFGKARSAFSIHEAASAYYLMRQRLIALYEESHTARLPRLVAVL